MSAGDKQILLRPTMRLRWKRDPSRSILPPVLQQFFVDMSFPDADGRSRRGRWLDVTMEVANDDQEDAETNSPEEL